MQGNGGTLSSPLYSDYDRRNLMYLEDMQSGCDDEY